MIHDPIKALATSASVCAGPVHFAVCGFAGDFPALSDGAELDPEPV
jgi:hypothetical protein